MTGVTDAGPPSVAAPEGRVTPRGAARAGGPLRARLLHTTYPHFGAYTGMIQLARFLDPARVSARVRPVSDGDDDLPVRHAAVRERLWRVVRRRGVSWYKLSDLYAEWRSLGACVLGRADVVHYMDGEHSASFLPAFLRRARVVPVGTVATFHQPAPLLDGLLNPSILADLDLITVVSPGQAEWFRAKVPGTPVEVVLHGVDTEFFSPGARAGEGADTDTGGRARIFRCVTAGHWLRDWEAARAVAERLAGERGVEFHVVTSRPTGMEGLPNVVFHRGISDVALREVYRGADALFLPLTDSTANNALLEGIACGLPVVSTALSGVRAYLPGEEAFLIEGNDPDLLADALLRLRRDPDTRRAMGRRARARAEALAWPLVARRFEDLYHSIRP